MMLSIAYLLITAVAAAGLLRAVERWSWRVLTVAVFGTGMAGALLWSVAARHVPFAPTYFLDSAQLFAIAALVPGLVAATILLPTTLPHDQPAQWLRARRVAWGVATVLWIVLAPVSLFFTACALDAHCDI